MEKNSSIFNFKRQLPYGFLVALLLVICIEGGLAIVFRHHIGQGYIRTTFGRLSEIDNLKPSSKIRVVLLGDSLAMGIDGPQANPLVLNLSTNWWLSMAGQYFILKKTFDQGLRPELCVVISSTSLWGNNFDTRSNLKAGDGYFFRPFASWDNIFELCFDAKRPDLAWRMIVKGLIPSAHFNKEMLALLIGDRLIDKPKIAINPRIREQNIKSFILRNPSTVSKLAKFYFRKICDLCRKNNTKLVILEAYIPESRFTAEVNHKAIIEEMEGVAKANDDVVVAFVNRKFIFPDSFFKTDGVHLADEAAKREFRDGVYKIIEAYLLAE